MTTTDPAAAAAAALFVVAVEDEIRKAMKELVARVDDSVASLKARLRAAVQDELTAAAAAAPAPGGAAPAPATLRRNLDYVWKDGRIQLG